MEFLRAHGVDGADDWGGGPWRSRSVSTVSLSACSDGGGLPPWWTLIWCQESCNKQECTLKRTVINDTAHDMGATLVCFKKAAKFATVMEQFNQSPYGLLTDWKESKPCLAAAEARPPSARPAFVVIYCELRKCRERATAWAGARPPGATPVRILADLDLLEFCLNGLVSDSKAPRGQFNLEPNVPRSPGQLGVRRSPQYVCMASCWPSGVRGEFQELALAEAPDTSMPALRDISSAPLNDKLVNMSTQTNALQQRVTELNSDLAIDACGNPMPNENEIHSEPAPLLTKLPGEHQLAPADSFARLAVR